MNWNLIGDLVLCFLIISGGVLFTYVNVNYEPNENND